MQKEERSGFAAARRDIKEVSKKSTLYCCEDHFKIEEDMENYFLIYLHASQTRVLRKKEFVKAVRNESRKKLIVDLMKQSVQKMETEITEECIPEETSQLEQHLSSISGIVQRREVTCQTKKFHFGSRGIQVHWKMKDAVTSPLKTVVSDLRKPAVKRVLQFNKGPVIPKLTSQPVDTSDSSDIYQPTESTGSDESQLK
ncbi:hypothetical protein NQ314_015671 [Rhamnusium bicolor]|uniref:Uncharacterized protein n=1 Tax=Rhamnusium bicolor TaxID=1586634 RepID=A0AAV8WXG4_9CUCU|nr:hypothetical protein NQ314_015671 [Rhamnusium bicolor]